MQQSIPSVLSMSNVGGKGSIRINKPYFALNGEHIAQYGVYKFCYFIYNQYKNVSMIFVLN
jgi:hypothetical protein